MEKYDFLESILKETAPTPSYVFDLDLLFEHVEKVKKCFAGKARVCYAMKANPFLTGPMLEHVDLFEVCSPGEFRICERTGVPMEKIVLSGVYKNPEDIQYVLRTYKGKGVYTVESWEHLTHLDQTAKELGLVVDVLLRVTSGNQFGMDEEDIRKIIRDRKKAYTGVNILGIQFYSGTQKRNLSQMEKELQQLDAFLGELKENYGFQAQELEYGPGFFAPYFVKDKEEPVEELLGEFGKILDGLTFGGNVILEMGRYLAYLCGFYLTSIVDMKVNHEQSYAIVDGGINHLNYYGQTMAMKQPYCTQLDSKGQARVSGEQEPWNLCGSLCTVSDVIVKLFPLKNPQIHDILIFERVGAYSVTEGIYLFLSRPMPKIYFWKDQKLTLVREALHTDEINSEREGMKNGQIN